MTFEQDYYERMSPNEWRIYKLNTILYKRREGRWPMIVANSNIEDGFDFGQYLRNSFRWADTPQDFNYWRRISLRS